MSTQIPSLSSLSYTLKCHFLTYTSHKRNNHSLHTTLSLIFSLYISQKSLQNLLNLKQYKQHSQQNPEISSSNPQYPFLFSSLPTIKKKRIYLSLFIFFVLTQRKTRTRVHHLWKPTEESLQEEG